MPNEADAPANYLTPFAAFPCVMIDSVMPTLKDTEWRLLCVIVRQTVGWAANGHRHKRRDWMTQSQLIVRTGRNSAAISAALDVLVRRRLVDATDEQGNLLLTPPERRRYSGRLYFGLCFEGIEDILSTSPTDLKIKESEKKSEVANANTTIAREDNKLPNGKNSSFKKVIPSLECRKLLRLYQDLFREKTLNGEVPPLVWGRDMKIASNLLRLYSVERLLTLLQRFFTSRDPWFERCGYSLPCFQTSLPKLLLQEGRSSIHGRAGTTLPMPSASFTQEMAQPRLHSGWRRVGSILTERHEQGNSV